MKKFTHEELASVLGVSRATLYNWKREGKIPNGDFTLEVAEEIVHQEVAKKEKELQRMRYLWRAYKQE